jgi:hypothetical protein
MASNAFATRGVGEPSKIALSAYVPFTATFSKLNPNFSSAGNWTVFTAFP